MGIGERSFKNKKKLTCYGKRNFLSFLLKIDFSYNISWSWFTSLSSFQILTHPPIHTTKKQRTGGESQLKNIRNTYRCKDNNICTQKNPIETQNPKKFAKYPDSFLATIQIIICLKMRKLKFLNENAFLIVLEKIK